MSKAADLQKKPEQVAGMFDLVAKRYDLTNLVMTFGLVKVWRKVLQRVVAPVPGQQILDIAAGTGASSVAFAGPGVEVTACDFSAGMVAEGRRRHPEINFIQGDALDLPFEDATFDCVTCSFGFRNMQDPTRALQEFKRVTKPGGKLVIMEFSTPPNALVAKLHRVYLETMLPWSGKLCSSDPEAYRYLMESVFDWPDQMRLGYLIKDSGWAEVEYRNLMLGAVAIHRAIKR